MRHRFHHDPEPETWRWRARLALLAAIVAAGLAVAALARYRPVYFVPRWTVANRATLALLVDPFRLRVRGTVAAAKRARNLWDVDRENQRLRREMTLLNGSNQALREQLGRVERLTGLGRWGAPPDVVFVPADVIAEDAYAGSILVINRGERDGVRPRDSVISLSGLVGVTRSVSARSAMVQSVTDPQSAVGAVSVTKSGRRVRGVVYGRGLDQPMEFVPENEIDPIEPGATVITSGFDNSVFPKGLVIGVIDHRGLDPYGLPIGVTRPAAPMRQVEDVMVVMPRERGAKEMLEPAFAVIDAPTTQAQSGGGSTKPIQLSMPSRPALSNAALTTSTRKLLETANAASRATRALAAGDTATSPAARAAATDAAPASATLLNPAPARPGPTPAEIEPAPQVVLPADLVRPTRSHDSPVPSAESFNEDADASSGGNQ